MRPTQIDFVLNRCHKPRPFDQRKHSLLDGEFRTTPTDAY